MDALCFDDVTVGQQWTSAARTVTQADVISFATTTGDFNPLHVDQEFASQGPYRKPIAHGLLGLSWVAGLGSTSPLMDTIAFTAVRQWEFLLPIFFGDTVHVVTRCLSKCVKGKKSGLILWERQLVNQRDQVVQRGNFETLVVKRLESDSNDRSLAESNDDGAVASKEVTTTIHNAHALPSPQLSKRANRSTTDGK